MAGLLLAELLIAFFSVDALRASAPAVASEISNTRAIGRVLYTDYIYLFQLAGLILLVAMVGAIALTLRRRSGVRRQNIAEQNARRREDTVEVVQVASRTGMAGKSGEGEQ